MFVHSNSIESFRSLKVLSKIKSLKVLTLHGNLVEDKKHYRKFVLSLLPGLTKLDFCTITKQDRDNARTWRSMRKRRTKVRDE
jgi:hypothetical protein